MNSGPPLWIKDGSKITGTINLQRCIDGVYVFEIQTKSFTTPWFTIGTDGSTIKNDPIPASA